MSELSRKRPHTDDGDVAFAKKRVLTGTNGTPHVNGHSDQTEDEQLFQANLDKFRKEAIFRRMKHYRQENDRHFARVKELELRKTTCEAGLAAMSACWAQLIETIRVFVKIDDLTSSNLQGKDVFDVVAHVEEDSLPQFEEALKETANVTEGLVKRLMKSGGGDNALAWKQNHLEDLQRSRTECVALRSQLGLLKKQLEDCESEKDKYYNDLLAAESRAERAQSDSVQSVFPQKGPPKSASTPKEGDATTTAAAADTPTATAPATEDTERKPSSPSQTSSKAATPAPANAINLLPEAAQIWEKQIEKLQTENLELKNELLNRPDKFKALTLPTNHMNLSKLRGHFAVLEGERDKARSEVAHLHATRADWETSIKAASEAAIDAYKTAMTKRDTENQRLRAERDQATAEMVERRQRDAYKWNATQETKKLLEAHSQRISVYKSELSRCKARLAAKEGQEDLLRFFLRGNDDEAVLIEELRREKEEALVRAQAAEVALTKLVEGSSASAASEPSSSSTSPPPQAEASSSTTTTSSSPSPTALVKALADAEATALRITRELDELKKVYGEDALSLPPDIAKLTSQIRAQAAELERLRLLQTQHEEEQAPLYAEMDKLSNDWEMLEKQVSDKVFDLAALEERMGKVVMEKAKSENKFYAAMREKEALEMERRAYVRTEEKHAAVMANMHAALSDKDNMIKALRDEAMQREHFLASVQSVSKENEGARKVAEAEVKRCQISCNAHIQGYNDDTQRLTALEKELRRKQAVWLGEKKGMEEQMQQLRHQMAAHGHGSGRGGGHGRERERSGESSEYNLLRKLLLCSTCETNFRAVIITKCMHTFCKDCVDARIATRQRKCPACNVAFSQSDVSTYYMQ